MKIVFGKKFFVVNMIRGTGQYEGLNEDDDVADNGSTASQRGYLLARGRPEVSEVCDHENGVCYLAKGVLVLSRWRNTLKHKETSTERFESTF